MAMDNRGLFGGKGHPPEVDPSQVPIDLEGTGELERSLAALPDDLDTEPQVDPDQKGLDFDVEKPDYDDRAHARASDPDTSKAAAAAVDMPKRQAEVLATLAGFPGRQATMQMVAKAMGVELVNVSPAFAPLRRKGKIVDSGERWKGETGRRRIVWLACNQTEGSKT